MTCMIKMCSNFVQRVMLALGASNLGVASSLDASADFADLGTLHEREGGGWGGGGGGGREREREKERERESVRVR